ncbi:hypothetical protein GCM10022224_097680 [Nonomuraea antimicrobica]|uniref:Integrase core domain-containing protein n=1 Tax=Nonomuraea antimicrobica TaxID=561173 RepID=A0ABP7ED35_9ACTN
MGRILADAGINTVLTGVRMPRMNSVVDRWVQSCRRELLDRCLLWNERHLRHALCEYEQFCNQHRARQALVQAAPLRAVPGPITDPAKIVDLNVRRRDRDLLDGTSVRDAAARSIELLGGIDGLAGVAVSARHPDIATPRTSGLPSGGTRERTVFRPPPPRGFVTGRRRIG